MCTRVCVVVLPSDFASETLLGRLWHLALRHRQAAAGRLATLLVWCHLCLAYVNLCLAFTVFSILNLNFIHFRSMKECTRGRVHQRLSENIHRICRLGILTYKQKTARASLICTAHGSSLTGLVCGRIVFHSYMHYFPSQEITCTCAFHYLSPSHLSCPIFTALILIIA